MAVHVVRVSYSGLCYAASLSLKRRLEECFVHIYFVIRGKKKGPPYLTAQ